MNYNLGSASGSAYSLGYTGPYAGGDTPQITPDGDTNQYGAETVTLTDWSESPTGATLDGVAVLGFSADSTSSVTFRSPGSVGSGDKVLVVSGPTESASATVTHTQPYPINIAAAAVDGKSILFGQKLGTGYAGAAYMDNAPAPYEIDGQAGSPVASGESLTFKPAYTDWSDAPIANDVNDYLQAPSEFEGWMRSNHTRIYPDGTAQSWVVEYEVTAGGVIVPGLLSSHRIKMSIETPRIRMSL
ncbi:hypothetical protein [Marinobacter sp. BGYM27]|uniref:hypothetical protein n=1 Tax=Marinobacter sp. BGYM27 TaxID=2975597 RepID=UPI0021A5C48C|nr:hypothetical protein [Marinobacter sp. BGYM27]MDG5498956.1 hypothetical protein [Marinobacter sp. BGYM27]